LCSLAETELLICHLSQGAAANYSAQPETLGCYCAVDSKTREKGREIRKSLLIVDVFRKIRLANMFLANHFSVSVFQKKQKKNTNCLTCTLIK